MPKVVFKVEGRTVEGHSGDSLLDVALDNDVELEHNCGGVCACTTCHCIILEGAHLLTDMEDDEDDRLLRAEGLTVRSRLGCQAKLKSGDGEVVVEIRPETQGWTKAVAH